MQKKIGKVMRKVCIMFAMTVICAVLGNVKPVSAVTHNMGNWYTESSATCTKKEVQRRNCKDKYCQYYETKEVGSLRAHTNSGQMTVVNPTCESDGYRVAYCTVCKKEIGSRTVLSKTGHDWRDQSVITNATCVSNGSMKQKCAKCGSYRTATIYATGAHAFNGQVKRKEATCTSEGYEVVICDHCGAEAGNRKTLSKKSHSYGDWTTIKNATCGADGSKERKCSSCGGKETQTIPKTEQHSWQDEAVILNPSCGVDGAKKQKCSSCGAGRTVSISALAHSPAPDLKKEEATCSKEGYQVQYCKNCKAELGSRSVIPMKEHTWVDQEKVAEASCTSNGAIKQKCSVCGALRTKVIEATNHLFNGIVKTVPATCKEEGYYGVVCEHCGAFASKTTIPKLDHTWETWIYDKDSNCEQGGTRHHVCSVCNTVESETLKPEGHLFEGQLRTVAATCKSEGYSVVVCSKCGAEGGERKILPITDHNWGTWIYDKEEGCTEYGTRHRSCKDCGKTEVQTVEPSDHLVEGQLKTKAATCLEDGYQVVVCSKCGKEMGNRSVLPAKGHKFGDYVLDENESTVDLYVYYANCINPGCDARDRKTKKPDEPEPTPIPYYLEYNANGGSGTMEKTYPDKGGHLYVAVCEYKKTGYKCPEWSDDIRSNAGMSYAPGTDIPRHDTPMTLYAEWVPITYTVAYNPNYPGAKDIRSSYVSYDESFMMPVPEREGYRFLRWKGAIDGKQVVFSAADCNSSHINLTANDNVVIHLTAEWEQVTGTSAINYYDSYSRVISDSVDSGSSYTIRNYMKKGCSVLGWSTEKGGNVVYYSGDSIPVTSNVTLYAVWKTFTITYNANGGQKCPDSQSATEGESIVITTSKPEKTGYRFKGWSYYPGDSGQHTVNVKSGETYSDGESLKLYAVWEANVYKVKYDLEYDSKTTTDTVTYDQSFYLNKPKRTGYTFVSWKGVIDGKQVYYSAASLDKPVINLTANNNVTISLHANWKENTGDGKKSGKTYTITYNANGGTGAPKAQTANKDEEIVLRKSKPSKTGYHFMGWSYFPGDSWQHGVDMKPGDSYDGGESLDLYAVWEANIYTVKYEPGYKNAKKISGITVAYDQDFYLTTPTRTGYEFVHWKGVIDGKQVCYSGADLKNSKRNLTANDNVTITLHAEWKKKAGYSEKTFTITYNANGGKNAPTAQGGIDGETIYITRDEPTKTGYTFKGWSYFPGDSWQHGVDLKGGDKYDGGESLKLYAVWDPHVYTVEYDPGYKNAKKITSQTFKYGEDIYLRTPTRKGYTFIHWKGVIDGKQVCYSADQIKNPMKNLTSTDKAHIKLKAEWKQESDNYSVKLMDGDTLVKEFVVDKGESIRFPNHMVNGTSIIGWSLKKDGSRDYKVNGTFTPTKNTVFYAVWQEITITYNANGGSGAPEKQTYKAYEVFNLRKKKPVKEGCMFMGWGYKSDRPVDEKSVAFQPGDKYDLGLSADLYAIWEEIIISPLKEFLQDKYGKVVMKDMYFDKAYCSGSWQKISKTEYFVIKTDTSTNAYDTKCFVIAYDDYTITVKEYGVFDGPFESVKTYILENNDNKTGAEIMFACEIVDTALNKVKSKVVNGAIVAVGGVYGKVYVYGKGAYKIVKKWIEAGDDVNTYFDTFTYLASNGTGHAMKYIFEFTSKGPVSAGDVIGLLNKAVKLQLETKAIEEENLDTYGDRDVAISTFRDHIAAAGFPSSVFQDLNGSPSGLRNTIALLYE